MFGIILIIIVAFLVGIYMDRHDIKIVKGEPQVNNDDFTATSIKNITESKGQDALMKRTEREVDSLKSRIKSKSEQGYYRYSSTNYDNTYENKTILNNAANYLRKQGFKVEVSEYGYSWLEIIIEWK